MANCSACEKMWFQITCFWDPVIPTVLQSDDVRIQLDVREQITKIAPNIVDVGIDYVGAENTESYNFRILNKGGGHQLWSVCLAAMSEPS